jgi:hypothetical protein
LTHGLDREVADPSTVVLPGPADAGLIRDTLVR